MTNKYIDFKCLLTPAMIQDGTNVNDFRFYDSLHLVSHNAMGIV